MSVVTAYLIYLPDGYGSWRASTHTFENGKAATRFGYSPRGKMKESLSGWTQAEMERWYGRHKGDPHRHDLRGPFGDMTGHKGRWRRVTKCQFLKFLRAKGVTP